MPHHPALYQSHRITADWPVLNALLGLALLIVLLVLLVRWTSEYNVAERLGYGTAGAAVFLSIFKQLGFSDLMLPFNDLYQMLWRVGWLLLLGGMLWRKEKHDRANRTMVRQAKRYFADKGAP